VSSLIEAAGGRDGGSGDTARTAFGALGVGEPDVVRFRFPSAAGKGVPLQFSVPVSPQVAGQWVLASGVP
jgi:hypothetical protein